MRPRAAWQRTAGAWRSGPKRKKRATRKRTHTPRLRVEGELASPLRAVSVAKSHAGGP
jgi:hypothetical protein